MKFWLSAGLTLLVTVGGLFGLSAGTHGFKVWTEEGQRRWSALQEPKPLPAFRWTNQDRTDISLASLNKPIVLLDFIYTRCPTVCRVLGHEFRQLQDQLRDKGLEDSVQLLSLSFDQQYDTPAAMADYLKRHRADPDLWQGGIITDEAVLQRLLKHLGVVVLPDEYGGYVHNAAFYLIYNGTLVSIHDQDQLPTLVKAVEQLSWSF